MISFLRVYVFLVLLLFSVLSNADSADDEYNNYVSELTAQRDSGQITSVERARLMRVKREQIYTEDSLSQEYWSYYDFIAYKRDNEDMSQQEANYLIKQKSNEIKNRRRQLEVTNSQPPRQIDYQCKKICVSQKMSYDYCDAKCSY